MRFWIVALVSFIAAGIAAYELSGIDPAFYDYDARINAMAGAGAALPADSPSALLAAGPAALADQKAHWLLQFSNSTYLDIISYNYAGISWKRTDGSVLAVAADFSGDEIFCEYELILSWSGKANLFFARSRLLDKLNLGANLKLLGSSFGGDVSGAYYDQNGLNHQVKGNSYGFALDCGAQYKIDDQHRLGLFNRNLLNTVFFDTSNEVGTAQGRYNESRPVALIWGYSYAKDAAILCLDYDMSLYKDRQSFLRSGLEIVLFADHLSLRGGICSQLYSLETIHYNLGCGINIAVMEKAVTLDMAYRIFPAWQGSNNLLFSLKFGI